MGSRGEHLVQEKVGCTDRADKFYQNQMQDRLNPWMRKFITGQEMVFIASADVKGECDSSFRAGPKGFVQVLDERTLLYPEFRGNGMFGSLRNMIENPHIGLLFLDFFDHTIGLHINGKAHLIFQKELLRQFDFSFKDRETSNADADAGAELWVVVEVEGAYIRCGKYIPRLAKPGSEISW
jgi:predicted pyridoxine 5'-phosphate oxidase superfamily flavin-nucleotide-binding protein